MRGGIIHKMAKNTNNSRARDPIKWVRDRAKNLYEKGTECAICGVTEDLEFHHYHSLTNLLEAWAKSKGYKLNTDEEVVQIRDEFIAEHHSELYEEATTLCNKHHLKLHSVYGPKPLHTTALKQKAWVEKQRLKFHERMADGKELHHEAEPGAADNSA